MKWPIVTCFWGTNEITNTCHCCAERRMVTQQLRILSKKGLGLYDFPTWLHRKYGTIHIERLRDDGTPGCSIPCVLCRKVLDKYRIKWTAFDGTDWVGDKAISRPTNKQKFLLGFS